MKYKTEGAAVIRASTNEMKHMRTVKYKGATPTENALGPHRFPEIWLHGTTGTTLQKYYSLHKVVTTQRFPAEIHA